MILSEQIKLCRKQLGMSQADLADAIWVSRNTVSNWERGDTTPDIQSLVLMSALFGLSLDEMVKGDEQVMAQALERDKNHLLIAGETFRPWKSTSRRLEPYNHAKPLRTSLDGRARTRQIRGRRCHRFAWACISPGAYRDAIQPGPLPYLG